MGWFSDIFGPRPVYAMHPIQVFAAIEQTIADAVNVSEELARHLGMQEEWRRTRTRADETAELRNAHNRMTQAAQEQSDGE